MRHRSRRSAPRIFQLLCTYLELSEVQRQGWWHALNRARYTTAAEFRRAVVVFESRNRADPETAMRFVQEVAPPARVVEMLEGLCHEQLLTRRETTALEERVFAKVVAGQQWK